MAIRERAQLLRGAVAPGSAHDHDTARLIDLPDDIGNGFRV
jgi:hypothetical protein